MLNLRHNCLRPINKRTPSTIASDAESYSPAATSPSTNWTVSFGNSMFIAASGFRRQDTRHDFAARPQVPNWKIFSRLYMQRSVTSTCNSTLRTPILLATRSGVSKVLGRPRFHASVTNGGGKDLSFGEKSVMFDPAKYHFIEYQARVVFFPWMYGVLGAVFAFEVPTAETQAILSRHVRLFHIGTIAMLATVVPIGILLKLFWPSVAISILLPLPAYSVFVLRNVRSLRRIPSRDSIAVFARHTGPQHLWQYVFMGILTVVFSIVFSVGSFFAMHFIAIAFAINSALALYALRFVAT